MFESNSKMTENSFKKDNSLLFVTILMRVVLFLVLYLPLFFFFRTDSSLYQWLIFYGAINIISFLNYIIFSKKYPNKLVFQPEIFQFFTIVVELGIITNIVNLSGGITSNFSFLYIFTIVSAAVSFNIKGAIISAVAVIFCLGLLYYFQARGIVLTEEQFQLLLKSYYFNAISFFAVGVVIGILTKKITMTEKYVNEREKFVAVGEISSKLAHEIKNPLAAIRGSVQLLAKGSVVNHQKLTNLIIKETDRLDNLLKDFFSLSKKREPEFEEVNIVELVNEILFLNMSEVSLKEKEHFDLILSDGYPNGIVYSDINLLRQILINLINNAIDESHKFEKKNTIEIEIIEVSGRVQVTVRDDCGGIDKEIFHDIFLPFVSKKLKGSGIGLSVVKSLVDQLYIDLSYRNIKEDDAVIGTEFVLLIDKTNRNG